MTGTGTGSSKTSTEETCPVVGTCTFTWNGASWSGSDDTSLCREYRPGQECWCAGPAGDGEYEGQIVVTTCYPGIQP